MRFTYMLVFIMILFTTATALAIAPTLNLEVKIAYEQGRFGAFYARCGQPDEKVVIGGSLVNWRMETFRGYQGNTEERVQLEKAFDTAALTVAADQAACKDWIKTASVTWHNITQLVQYGEPAALQH